MKPKFTPGPWAYGVHSSDGKPDGCLVWDLPTGCNVASLWASLRTVEKCEENAKLISAAPDMYEALDEADTAFAVLNVSAGCSLTPQARRSLGEAWVKVQEVLGRIHGPDSAHAEAALENRKTLEGGR